MQVVVCALPDMLTWSHDGSRIFAACEGEPSTQVRSGEVHACTHTAGGAAWAGRPFTLAS